MVGWHHWLHRHAFEQNLSDSEGQGRLECCSPWNRKEGRHKLVTEQQKKPSPPFPLPQSPKPLIFSVSTSLLILYIS